MADIDDAARGFAEHARLWAIKEAIAQRPTLFDGTGFTSHSGEALPWKIDCEVLTDKDWEGLALMASEMIPAFDVAFPIPRGGNKLAGLMNTRYRSGSGQHLPALVCDDVLTTGASMVEEMSRLGNGWPQVIGLVVFARGPLPKNVYTIFAMPPAIVKYNIAGGELVDGPDG